MTTEVRNKLLVAIDTLAEEDFGDHAERVRVSHEFIPGETIEDLLLRVFPKLTQRFQTHNISDWIEIRVQLPRDGNSPDLTSSHDDNDLPPF